ncbi:TIGR04282 family arsenosugar biosynthesis glycosyltransferase [Nocardioides sp. LHD-245]|uniref:TIGR04282 family arsenosugar biosynthesis glycosyltransferase n=1 Tax=Nocardioides sp. LHD-245 TaxID=3051387 RepID=UPI0027E1A292|nr:TIGR04282 family arsenosugar biosynthesis glycosyltransferase [Nocardioides sp. LHD-245]
MTTIVVIAKAPVPGRVKTRLAVDIGEHAAARIASVALLDTIDACASAVGPGRCRLAVAGDLEDAVDGLRIRRALAGWSVVPQVAGSLGGRIAAAFAALPGPVVQVGMDTPQVTSGLLLDAVARLERHDAVLGPAEDGGWWLLGLREPSHATAVAAVPMSTARTGVLTREALEAAGLSVADAPVLRDIDVLADLQAVTTTHPRLLTSAAGRALP